MNCNQMIDYNRFQTITSNREIVDEMLDQAMSVPVQKIKEPDFAHVYDFDQDFFGIRLITNQANDPLSFYPIFYTGQPCIGTFKAVGEFESEYDAIRSISMQEAYLNTIALDHVFYRENLPEMLSTDVSNSLGGLAISLEKQENPPSIQQPDGTLVTTKGSSIFYNMKGQPQYHYVYQLHIDGVKSIYWNNLIEIYQISTTLFRTKNLQVDFRLYATKRVLQGNYSPKKGDDVMGIMQLCSNLI